MRSLGQQQDKLSQERQRQTEIARLKREHRRSLLEEQFDAAALVMGLARTQEAAYVFGPAARENLLVLYLIEKLYRIALILWVIRYLVSWNK